MMAILSGLFVFFVAFVIMLTMAWIIASQSLYLHDIKAGKGADTVQRFRDELNPPVQFLVNHYLAQGPKKLKHTTFKVIFTHIFRVLMAIIYLFFLFGFAVQVVIYWETEEQINSIFMGLATIVAIWQFIGAWQFGQKMTQLKK
jgi:hypothetical protein